MCKRNDRLVESENKILSVGIIYFFVEGCVRDPAEIFWRWGIYGVRSYMKLCPTLVSHTFTKDMRSNFPKEIFYFSISLAFTPCHYYFRISFLARIFNLKWRIMLVKYYTLYFHTHELITFTLINFKFAFQALNEAWILIYLILGDLIKFWDRG